MREYYPAWQRRPNPCKGSLGINNRRATGVRWGNLRICTVGVPAMTTAYTYIGSEALFPQSNFWPRSTCWFIDQTDEQLEFRICGFVVCQAGPVVISPRISSLMISGTSRQSRKVFI